MHFNFFVNYILLTIEHKTVEAKCKKKVIKIFTEFTKKEPCKICMSQCSYREADN